MNLDKAKQHLVRAGAFLPVKNGDLPGQSQAAGAAGEISALAAMLDADDPAQAEILKKVFAALDDVKLVEKHSADAARKVEDAYVLLVRHEKTLPG